MSMRTMDLVMLWGFAIPAGVLLWGLIGVLAYMFYDQVIRGN